MRRFAFLPPLLLLLALSVAANDIPLSAPGNAVIGRPQSASGAGLDVIVWMEQTAQGAILVAKRVAPGGAPLDAEGIVIAADSSLQGQFDVAFDGSSFVVAWVRDDWPRRSIVLRFLSPDGALSDPTVLATWDSVWNLSAAGGGNGRFAIAWSGSEGPGEAHRTMLAPFIGGTAREAVPIASGEFDPAAPLAATAGGYLAAFMQPIPCRILCLQSGPLYARLVGFDGTLATEIRLLSNDVDYGAEVVTRGDSSWVRWGDEVLRVGSDARPASRWDLMSEGITSLSGGVLRVDHGIARASYSLDGVLLRLSPLGLRKGETEVGALSSERILLLVGPDTARQLVIRSVESPAAADLAVVATGVLLPGTDGNERRAVFRIGHRGGAPVNRIEFRWSTDHRIVAVPGDTWQSVTRIGDMVGAYGTVLEKTLREGESFEVAIPVHLWMLSADLWIAGDVLDEFPANNVDRAQEPLRPRRRAARR